MDLSGPGFTTFAIESEHGAQLQHLLELCADSAELTFGHPPGPADAQSLFYAGPEEGAGTQGRDAAGRKMLLGIKTPGSDRMAGVLDGFAGYPAPGVWYIGLLLLAPDVRGQGVGNEIVEAFARAAAGHGAYEIQLNVVEDNQRGRRFWSSCGFSEVRRWRRRFGERDRIFIRMRRSLAPVTK